MSNIAMRTHSAGVARNPRHEGTEARRHEGESSRSRFVATVMGVLLCLASRAHAYVDLAPTLGKVLGESQSVVLVEVDRFSREKGALILKKVRDLKGQSGADPIRHQVVATPGSPVSRPILEWAEPGRRAVVFVSTNAALVCVGRSWYQVQASTDGWWRMGQARPDLPLAYCGTVSRLSDAIEQMVAGKTAVITTVPQGADDEAASFDLALNRTNLPGLLRLQRLRASLQMPQMVAGTAANSGWVIGPGTASDDEIPSLIAKLQSPDVTVRAESADDLRTLGSRATAATPALSKLLDDPSPVVRMSAAAALLRISPKDASAASVLSKGLDSTEAAVRCQAVRAVGLAGDAAAPLASKLAQLLTDADELTRLATLQTIATLGPAAAGAWSAVAKLLDDPQMAVDAADALGRIGPPARPALKRLAQMLSADDKNVRWAAVRAMSQIGGEDAAPAVQFMIKELPQASELNGYNMMIYFGLLGPVAKEAIPAIQSSGVKQPALKPATVWAIEPDKRFPWLSEGGRFGGPMQDGEVSRFIYQAYVSELGERLKPAARVLAQKIMDGTAGEMPVWAYRVLAASPDEVMAILTPALADQAVVNRERAAVALGYMGATAAPARQQVAEAARKAPTEREQRLMKWCLREVSSPQATE